MKIGPKDTALILPGPPHHVTVIWRIHNDVRYSPDASSKVDYFLFLLADVKCGRYEINKTTEQILHMDRVRSTKYSENEPERRHTREAQDQDLY